MQEKEEKAKFKLESKEKLKDEKKDKVKDKEKEKVKEKDKEKVKEKDKDKKEKKLTKMPSTVTSGVPFEEIFTLGGEHSCINFAVRKYGRKTFTISCELVQSFINLFDQFCHLIS